MFYIVEGCFVRGVCNVTMEHTSMTLLFLTASACGFGANVLLATAV